MKARTQRMKAPSCPWCKKPMTVDGTQGFWDVGCFDMKCPIQPQMSLCYFTREAAIRAWNAAWEKEAGDEG